ncbi:unnamed protein product [Porites lobata]|uniref:Uncharacterized protein n=1 Tax=Porites lobata TaxID=104759 RepID=A0ABN8RSY0_9CNID|nr:unnamed protein product [Porites lobata]
MAEWTWQQILWIARWTWDKATDFAEWTWYQLTDLANGIWDTIAWIINFCFTSICAFIDTVSELYAVHVKSHVTYIRSLFGGITRQEIIRTLITSVVLVSTLLFINKTIRYVIRRRRQVRLENEAAECVVCAASQKPIWRPKPKKKKKIDKKGW